jgi:outer membrane lipoprotein-sorting protein
MTMFEKRPALRWIAPLAVVAVVGGTGMLASTASADPTLAPKSAEQLLVDVQQAKIDGLSGTVVQKAELGLPALPSGGSAAASELTSLLSGNHTLKVWTAGPDKLRVAVLDRMAETDVIVNGSDVWTYASQTNEATHRTLPKLGGHADRPATPASPDVPKTPQEAAAKVLAAVGPTTNVTTDASETVAGRPAYVLVLTPKDEGSLIGQVKIAVDSETSVPLDVQALTDDGTVVLDLGYTDVSFATPEAGRFIWVPPKDAKVTEAATPAAPKAPSAAERKAARDKLAQVKNDTKTFGQGWATVVVSKLPAGATTSGQVAGFVNTLPKASGTTWAGHVFAGTAFSAVLTDDGRLAVGAVKPDLLYDALEK